ncbi:MAG TPA: lipopolysaccharide assembly protein LapA domain-containing protein [Longimicrobiales bacterium]|nr:lipopolysaccharide assembly protein LapA domain-containing protein [Longimicrobiales bacterium]
MIRRPGLIFGVLLFGVVGYISYLNTGERVVLDLGFVVLYRVPVSVLLFGATFAGMLLMFLAGLPTDLKVRRMLRDRPERLDREL